MGHILEGRDGLPSRPSEKEKEKAKPSAQGNNNVCQQFIVQGTGTFIPPPSKNGDG